MRTLDPDRFEPACGHLVVAQDVRDCEEITFNAETAEPAEKFLLLLKATTKARRHEESQGAFRVFVSSWLHFSVSSAFTRRIFKQALHRMATGAIVEPVPPWIFSGSTTNANS